MLIYYCYHPSEGSLRTASEFVGMDQPSARAKVEADLNATTLEMNRAIRDVERRPGLALNLQLAQHWHREAVMQMCRYCSHYGVSYFHRVSSDTVWTDTEPRPKLTLQEARTVLSRLHTERFTEQHWGEFVNSGLDPYVVIDSILEWMHSEVKFSLSGEVVYKPNQPARLQFLWELLERYFPEP